MGEKGEGQGMLCHARGNRKDMAYNAVNPPSKKKEEQSNGY